MTRGASLIEIGLLAGLMAGAGGCRPGGGSRLEDRMPAPTPTLTPTPTPTEREMAAPTATATPTGDVGSFSEESDSDQGGPLVGEERERDPRSETVTIRVTVDPPRKAHVLWGRKDFGEAPLEIVRPRNSGPLDIIVEAPRYLRLHARAFTDRDDKLPLHLYAAGEATQLLGYRSEQKISENRPQKSPADRSRGDSKERPKKK